MINQSFSTDVSKLVYAFLALCQSKPSRNLTKISSFQSLRCEEGLCDVIEVASLEKMLIDLSIIELDKAINAWVHSAYGNVFLH